MTQSIENFKGIRKVALLIAYDNGIINRDEHENYFLRKVNDVIGADGVDYADLKLIEDWLTTLSDDDIETFATGEHLEMTGISSTFSEPELLEIFNDIAEL